MDGRNPLLSLMAKSAFLGGGHSYPYILAKHEDVSIVKLCAHHTDTEELQVAAPGHLLPKLQ